MFNFLIALILSTYSAAPQAFWAAAVIVGLSALGLLMLMGLCRVAGEADEWADDRLAQFRAEGT